MVMVPGCGMGTSHPVASLSSATVSVCNDMIGNLTTAHWPVLGQDGQTIYATIASRIDTVPERKRRNEYEGGSKHNTKEIG